MVQAHVSDEKKKIVENLKKLISENHIIALVDMENLPAKQLNNMRKSLRETVTMIMTKKRLMRIAINAVKDSKPGIEKLEELFRGMPALLFTKDNPFRLYKVLKENKSKAPAKAGQTAPNDIVVSAGPTPFAPGPVIGELGAIGIKTAVEDGKIAIKEDAIVVKEGDEINQNVAEMLLRLGIEPMEIGLNVVGVYEDGTIFGKETLDIDEQEYIDNITKAHSWAFNLSVEAGIVNKSNIELMLTKAFKDSKGVALEANILADAVLEEVLGKAERQANSLKTTANIPEKAPKAEEKPAEEPKAEEKPAEEPKEEKPAEEAKEEPEEIEAEKQPEQIEQKDEEKALPEVKPEESKEVQAQNNN